MLDHRLAVAPMLDCTDRFFRYFVRLITRHTVLYTEMITTGSLLHGDAERILAYDPLEHPLALQLGGSNPMDLARCARLAQDCGYDEVNLNLGCPSSRVQSGRFGACLMAEPGLVADCIRAMREAVSIPLSVKTRTGIDHDDSYENLAKFVAILAEAGNETFIIHARKAWLDGLSPRQNRELPPLDYGVPMRLKRDFPQLEIVLNGGVKTLEQAAGLLEGVDGVMIGREAYQNPWMLAQADVRFFDSTHQPRGRHQVLNSLLPFVERQLEQGVALQRISRHILGLYRGVPGARSWRRHLSEQAPKGGGAEVIRQAAAGLAET